MVMKILIIKLRVKISMLALFLAISFSIHSRAKDANKVFLTPKCMSNMCSKNFFIQFFKTNYFTSTPCLCTPIEIKYNYIYQYTIKILKNFHT